jgi:hypothetical protein
MKKSVEVEPFIIAGILAAQSSFRERGFRQKDVKYFIELFSNWIEALLPGPSIELKNTQVQRLIEEHVSEGVLQKISEEEKRPRYLLTRMGLHELVSKFVSVDIRPIAGGLGTFLFIYQFIKVYSFKIEELFGVGGQDISPSFRIELKHLLQANILLERQKEHVKKEIEKLEWRIEEAVNASAYSKKLFKEKSSISEVVEKIQLKFPYDLNYQKTMVDLYKDIPNDMKRFELEEAPIIRAESIWKPLRNLFNSYLSELENLK